MVFTNLSGPFRINFHLQTIKAEAVTWSVCCMLANLGICVLGCWRCFANNYLHWAATCTWLLLNLEGIPITIFTMSLCTIVVVSHITYSFIVLSCTGFIGEGVGFDDRECIVWYMLFIIFVPYAMLPLPLKWCMIAGTVSAAAHLIVISIVKIQKNSVNETNRIAA